MPTWIGLMVQKIKANGIHWIRSKCLIVKNTQKKTNKPKTKQKRTENKQHKKTKKNTSKTQRKVTTNIKQINRIAMSK